MAFHSDTEIEEKGNILKLRFFENGQQLKCAMVYTHWQLDEEFRNFCTETLSEIPFKAFRWETPPVTAKTAGQYFEFVIVDSPYLSLKSKPRAFQEHFVGSPQSDIVVFPNLGKDSVMIVPVPLEDPEVYAHLASFLRGAPERQIHALWIAVGKAMEVNLGENPIWLNTAGGGVPWLHVRLDSRPKYYVYGEYRNR